MQLAVVDESGPRGRQFQEPEPLPCFVTAAAGSRLDFSWGIGQLHIAEVACPSTGAGGVSPYAGSCEWTSLLPIQRKTAYGMMPPYIQLQRFLLRARGGVPEQARQARLEFSDAVQAVLQEACSVLASGGGGEEELQVGYEAALWELLVLCFLRCDDLEMGALPEAFAGWMLQHGSLFSADRPGFSQLHATAAELLQDPRVDTNPAYWPTVHRLVLLGQVELAGSLLARHPVMAASKEPGMADMAQGFELVYQALREVPRLGRDTGSIDAFLRLGGAFTEDIVQFNAERQQWEYMIQDRFDHRKDLLAELQHRDPAAAKGLASILVMLTADPSEQPAQSLACKRMSKAACNWVELMTGMMLWQHRKLPFMDLPAEASVARMLAQQPRNTDREFHDFFTQVFVAASQQQVQEVIQLCTNSSYASIKFVAHSFEVMRGLPEAARVIARPLPHLGCDQAESFLLNYAEVLIGGAATWAVGAEYLAWCPVYGADALEAMLEKSPYPLVDQQSALQALAIARRHSLSAAACNLARRLSAAEEERGHMAGALLWALQARDPQRCAQLVAPLNVKILELLLPEGDQQFRAAPLNMPELYDLEPLLLNLPDSTAGSEAAAEGVQQPQQPRSQRYPELHFLRAMLQLQQALEEVQRCQQPVQQPEQPTSAGSAHSSVNSTMQAVMLQQQTAARQAAYAQVQQPVQQLLLDTPALAPAELQLPLLVYLAPVLESVHMPFSRDQVDELLALKRKRTQPGAEAIAIAEGSSGNGLRWPVELSHGGPKAAALQAAGLALLNGRSRANVRQYSMQAW